MTGAGAFGVATAGRDEVISSETGWSKVEEEWLDADAE
jgi:hypothetical protein